MASYVCLQYLCNYSHFQKLETEVLHYRFKINLEQILSFKPAVLILGVGCTPVRLIQQPRINLDLSSV